jgi:hypothetical protein
MGVNSILHQRRIKCATFLTIDISYPLLVGGNHFLQRDWRGRCWGPFALFRPPGQAVQWLFAPPDFSEGKSICSEEYCHPIAATLFEDGKERQNLCWAIIFHLMLGSLIVLFLYFIIKKWG